MTTSPLGATEVDGTTCPIPVQQLDHIVLRVRDPEVSVAWYTETFGLRPLRLEEYRAGTVPFPSVEITPGTVIDLDARREPTGTNLSHFCLVVAEMDFVLLAASGRFPVIDGPHRRWGARGPADLVYIQDPDGNTIELRHYGPSQVES